MCSMKVAIGVAFRVEVRLGRQTRRWFVYDEKMCRLAEICLRKM